MRKEKIEQKRGRHFSREAKKNNLFGAPVNQQRHESS
jgi:hypothetical protein